MPTPTITRPTDAPPAAWTARDVSAVPRVPPSAILPRRDDWPHTGRILPWMVAAFMAMLWLTPFHAIQLTVPLPFGGYLDRIVLPVIAVAWLLALAAGGRHAPRLRLSRIHVALGVFLAIACVSVVLHTTELNHDLLLDQSIKRLVLLSSYAAMFVIVASVVRRSEVRAFLLLMLGLSVVCAIGILWENSFHFNVFYTWSAKVLPGIFKVPVIDTSGFDDTGRRLTIGPAELGLETVGMLAMALPIAIVGIMHAEERRSRVLYGLSVCLIVAAAFCTYRKSALVAPVTVMLAIAFFRRREMMRLAPLGLVLLVMVHFLAPGAIGGVTSQLTGGRLSTDNTTTHRTAGYDAVRPLVWDHVAFGQGYGSYDAYANHILDSQILTAVIETGVLGAAAYVIMILSVVSAARPYIRSREKERAPPALIAAAAAIGLLCVSTLYDVMVFPHVPYIFLCLAAFMAVLYERPAAKLGHAS
jgi:hypothetical protein